MSKHKRPLSPHLQIYKPQITSTLSIFHRFAGVGLACGAVLLVLFLSCLMTQDTYEGAKSILANPFVQFICLGYVVALCFYFFGIVRHLFWDVGLGFELKTVYASGWMLIAATCISSALIIGAIIW